MSNAKTVYQAWDSFTREAVATFPFNGGREDAIEFVRNANIRNQSRIDQAMRRGIATRVTADPCILIGGQVV